MSGNGHQEIVSGKGFFRIGQVSRLTDTKPFVIRYWETEFPMLQPLKSPGGRRLYRREDVETVLLIKRLLYDEGFTIAGARRHLRENGAPHEVPAPGTELRADMEAGAADQNDSAAAQPVRPASRPADSPVNISRKVLLDLRDSLRAFLTLLENE